jgi:hypothetical protein
MSSVKLTKALAPQVIAGIATALANILLVLGWPESTRGKFGITLNLWRRRARQSRVEHALRALAMQPRVAPESLKVLERGFREVTRQVTRMRREAEKNAARAGKSSSPQTRAERWSRSGKSAQMLLCEVEQVYHQLDGYLTAIAAGDDYYVHHAEIPGIDVAAIAPGQDIAGSALPSDGEMLYQA